LHTRQSVFELCRREGEEQERTKSKERERKKRDAAILCVVTHELGLEVRHYTDQMLDSVRAWHRVSVE
jgi:hypothetical protein